MIQHINDKNFKEEVLGSKDLTLVDFYGEWCRFCNMFSPVFDSLSSEYSGKVKFCKSNVDETPKYAGKFHVNGVPYLLLFREGTTIGILNGLKTRNEVKGFLDSFL